MRRISANYIFPICSKPIKNGILEIDSSGKILKIIDTQGDLRESARLEFYNGIIIPEIIVENELVSFLLSYQRRFPEKTLLDILKQDFLSKLKNDKLIFDFGVFKPEEKVKVFLISKVNFQEMKITSESYIKRLV